MCPPMAFGGRPGGTYAQTIGPRPHVRPSYPHNQRFEKQPNPRLVGLSLTRAPLGARPDCPEGEDLCSELTQQGPYAAWTWTFTPRTLP